MGLWLVYIGWLVENICWDEMRGARENIKGDELVKEVFNLSSLG